ncbi:hypothetical protein C1H46_038713 [Malus baccata]|uniref:Uncharacterized protein n=1 Tax=Malus baccata TaxID=106549 RepID=A0A540KNG3_MALBA|nr:hypothetical protein C1H46_038713 [Malus baccata]
MIRLLREYFPGKLGWRGKGRVEGDGEGNKKEEEQEVRGTKKRQRSEIRLQRIFVCFSGDSSGSYIENSVVEDNKEAADPQAAPILYNQEPRGCGNLTNCPD